MTFTHLMNCVILTYGPLYTIYSGANLGEYSLMRFSYKSTIYYGINILLKMILYATVIPFNLAEGDKSDISHEILKTLINILEVVLIRYSLQERSPYQDKETGLKVLNVGLTWSLIESLCSYLLYFLMNATGEEFRWEYIQTAIQSNFDLIERIAIVALIECYEKQRKSNGWNFHLLILIMIKYFISGLGFKYLEVLKSNDQWIQLGKKGAYTIMFAFITRIIFSIIFKFKTEEEIMEEEFQKSRREKKDKFY